MEPAKSSEAAAESNNADQVLGLQLSQDSALVAPVAQPATTETTAKPEETKVGILA